MSRTQEVISSTLESAKHGRIRTALPTRSIFRRFECRRYSRLLGKYKFISSLQKFELRTRIFCETWILLIPAITDCYQSSEYLHTEMLLADNFHPLVLTNLKIIPYFTVPLHLPGKSQDIQIAAENKFLKRAWITVPYLTVMFLQWIFAMGQETLSVILESTLFCTCGANAYLVVPEHYRWRREIANLYNSFLEFERRHNG